MSARDDMAAIVAARKVRGWSRADLARSAGMSPHLLGRLERGKEEPSREALARLAEAVAGSPLVPASGRWQSYRVPKALPAAGCPACGSQDSAVIDSRPGPHGIRRRRRCLGCRIDYSTLEVTYEAVGVLCAVEERVAAVFRAAAAELEGRPMGDGDSPEPRP